MEAQQRAEHIGAVLYFLTPLIVGVGIGFGSHLPVAVALAVIAGCALGLAGLYAIGLGTHCGMVCRVAQWKRKAGYRLASGTSSCAAAAAAVRSGRCKSPVTVRMPGGEMLVEIDDDWQVRLTGTVSRVCRGEWDVEV